MLLARFYQHEERFLEAAEVLASLAEARWFVWGGFDMLCKPAANRNKIPIFQAGGGGGSAGAPQASLRCRRLVRSSGFWASTIWHHTQHPPPPHTHFSGKSSRTRAAGAGEFLHDLEEKMQVAQLQQRIYQAIQRRRHLARQTPGQDLWGYAGADYDMKLTELDEELKNITDVSGSSFCLQSPWLPYSLTLPFRTTHRLAARPLHVPASTGRLCTGSGVLCRSDDKPGAALGRSH